MNREQLINRILEKSGDEFETSADYIELAKETESQLQSRVIHINNYEIEQRRKSGDLGSQIKTYSNWLLTECCDPIDEIEFLVNTIIDDNRRGKSEIIEVLAFVTESKEFQNAPDFND